jgi:serine phosphatase RsbU (regulator of sigma subunit)
MWIGCQGGVSRYDLQTGKIENYDYSTGFDGDCLLGSMTKTDDILWVGTTNSLWKYDEKDVLKTNISLKAIIEAVNVNNSPTEQTKNVFSYSENKFRFEYYTSQMYQNEKVLFQYRLIGVDTAFSLATSQKEVSYIELPAGKYTFEVKACLDDVCSLKNASYSFEISPPFWKTWWFRLLSGLTIIMLFYLIYRMRTETLRKRQVELERMVEIRTFEVVQEKKEVERQKHLVDEKNKEITDSITYAKRIQEAILPSRYSLAENLQNGFILFKPKDIVSGDFYWLEKQQEQLFFAAADCTGHGVPGAMVSVVCANSLSKALLEENLTAPGKLLDRTRELVVQRFEKSGEDVKDGMDISLCSLNFSKKYELSESYATLQWAGANNPLWIIRKAPSVLPEGEGNPRTSHPQNESESSSPSADGRLGRAELIEYKANKQPIGKVDNPKPFTTHTIDLQKGDTIYIFTDGFADQFGGEKGKKLMYKPFKELLLSIQDKTMNEQKELLEEHFENWKGNLEQVDDVCVIGVRI